VETIKSRLEAHQSAWVRSLVRLERVLWLSVKIQMQPEPAPLQSLGMMPLRAHSFLSVLENHQEPTDMA
jgi:hypothetical protein